MKATRTAYNDDVSQPSTCGPLTAAGQAGVRMGAGGSGSSTVTATWTDFTVVILTYRQTVYDGGGLVIAEVDELANRTSYTYDLAGRRIAMKNPLGAVTTMVYDPTGLVLAVVDPLGGRSSSIYDLDSRRVAAINALSQITTTLYNPTGTVLAAIDPLGQRTTYGYDLVDRQIAWMDAESHTSTTVYDLAGQAIAMVNALGQITTTVYDADSRRLRLIDANNHGTTFLYDRLSRDAGSIDPLGRIVTFGYDAAGNRNLKIDPRNQRTTSVYDLNHRLLTEAFVDGSRNTYTYDFLGNRVSMADSTGVTTNTYSPRSEVLSVKNPDGKLVQYAYDAIVNRRHSMTDADSGVFASYYDTKDRLIGLVNPRSETTSISYDAVDRQVSKRLGNNSRSTLTYDAGGRLTALWNTLSDGSIVNRFSYTYDKAGHRTRLAEFSGVVTTWTYDATYQLVHEQRNGINGFNVAYTYDAVGNRLIQVDSGVITTSTYDAANELLTARTGTQLISYSYDANGNRMQKDDSVAGITYYTWDPRNRMALAEPLASPVSFTYNATGQRMEKVVGSRVKKFIYDFEKVLQETDGSGTTDKLYTTTNEVYGELLSEFDGGDSLFHHQYDAVGSTDALLNSEEARYTYRAFGLEVSYTTDHYPPTSSSSSSSSGTAGSSSSSSLSSSPSPDSNYTYVGQQGYFRDLEIDLYFVRARYYDFATGQWISQDPKGVDAGDTNTYRYVANDPVNNIDPSGLELFTLGGKALEFVEQKLAKFKTVHPDFRYRVEPVRPASDKHIRQGIGYAPGGVDLYVVIVSPGSVSWLRDHESTLAKDGMDSLIYWDYHTVFVDHRGKVVSHVASLGKTEDKDKTGKPAFLLDLEDPRRRLIVRYNFEMGYSPRQLERAEKFIMNPAPFKKVGEFQKSGTGHEDSIEEMVEKGEFSRALARFNLGVQKYPGFSSDATNTEVFLDRYVFQPLLKRVGLDGKNDVSRLTDAIVSAVAYEDYRPLMHFFGDKAIEAIVKELNVSELTKDDAKRLAKAFLAAALTGDVDLMAIGPPAANIIEPGLGDLLDAVALGTQLGPQRVERAVGVVEKLGQALGKGVSEEQKNKLREWLQSGDDEKLLEFVKGIDEKLIPLVDIIRAVQKEDEEQFAKGIRELVKEIRGALPNKPEFDNAKQGMERVEALLKEIEPYLALKQARPLAFGGEFS